MQAASRGRCFFMRQLLLAVLAAFALPAVALTQVVDPIITPGAVIVRPGSDSLSQRPLTPARAFIYSLLVPGLSQSIMKRQTATVVFSGVEIVGLAMLHRSVMDLRRARAFARDSVVESYRINATTGLVERDADTGEPLVATYVEDVFREGLITARRRHVEDWAALVVFNHFLSAADALVAAHLWDVPVQLGFRSTPNGGMLTGTIAW